MRIVQEGFKNGKARTRLRALLKALEKMPERALSICTKPWALRDCRRGRAGRGTVMTESLERRKASPLCHDRKYGPKGIAPNVQGRRCCLELSPSPPQ